MRRERNHPGSLARPEGFSGPAACSNFPAPLLLPCFWPHLCILSPVYLLGYVAAKGVAKGTTYVLTDRGMCMS